MSRASKRRHMKSLVGLEVEVTFVASEKPLEMTGIVKKYDEKSKCGRPGYYLSNSYRELLMPLQGTNIIGDRKLEVHY